MRIVCRLIYVMLVRVVVVDVMRLCSRRVIVVDVMRLCSRRVIVVDVMRLCSRHCALQAMVEPNHVEGRSEAKPVSIANSLFLIPPYSTVDGTCPMDHPVFCSDHLYQIEASVYTIIVCAPKRDHLCSKRSRCHRWSV